MSRKTKKEEHERDDSLANTITATLAPMLQEHRAAILAEIKSSYIRLEAKMDSFQTTITDHQQRILELESFANSADSSWQATEAKLTVMAAENAKLKAKLIDLEGRSRRNNIRVIGIPENIEGPQPTVFFSQMLFEVLGDNVLTSPPELDCAHRTRATKPGPSEKPRPVVMCFHRPQIRELVLREARKLRGKIKYKDSPIFIFEDYCPEIMEQRAQYRDVMKELYSLGLKPSLRYPAKLSIVTKDGSRKHLSSVGDAKNFIVTNHRPVAPVDGN